MSRISAKFVPKILSGEQKQNRVRISQEMLKNVEDGPDYLTKVITGDESWVYSYDPETKAQSSQWITTKHYPKPKKGRMEHSRIKTMLIVFLDMHGIVHHEFVPTSTMVNAAFYRTV